MFTLLSRFFLKSEFVWIFFFYFSVFTAHDKIDIMTMKCEIRVTRVDRGDWIFGGLIHLQVTKCDKTGTKESVIVVHGKFPLKSIFPRQQQRQKRDWDQRPSKLTVWPRPLALWARGSLGRWSRPGQLYTLDPQTPKVEGSFSFALRDTDVEKFEELHFTKSPLSLMAIGH